MPTDLQQAIERAQEMRDAWNDEAHNSNRMFSDKANVANQIIIELQSLAVSAPTSPHIADQDLAEALMAAAIGKVHPDTWRAIADDIADALSNARVSLATAGEMRAACKWTPESERAGNGVAYQTECGRRANPFDGAFCTYCGRRIEVSNPEPAKACPHGDDELSCRVCHVKEGE